MRTGTPILLALTSSASGRWLKIDVGPGTLREIEMPIGCAVDYDG